MGTITIEIDEKDALVRHNESLQAALTKRKAEIQRLTDLIEAGEGSPLVADAYEKGRKEGWKQCASDIMRVANDTAGILTKLREEAFQRYLVADRFGPESVVVPIGDESS